MRRLSLVASLLMLVAGGVVGIYATSHVVQIRKQRARLESDRVQLLKERTLCNRLDNMRAEAAREIAFVTPLLNIARRRIEWSGKLEQFAAAVGPNGGIQMLSANSGDVFAETGPDAKVAAHSRTEPTQFTFAVMMPMSSSTQLNTFAQTLAAMPGFTAKLGPVQTESVELDPQKEGTVAILRGGCKSGGLRP